MVTLMFAHGQVLLQMIATTKPQVMITHSFHDLIARSTSGVMTTNKWFCQCRVRIVSECSLSREIHNHGVDTNFSLRQAPNPKHLPLEQVSSFCVSPQTPSGVHSCHDLTDLQNSKTIVLHIFHITFATSLTFTILPHGWAKVVCSCFLLPLVWWVLCALGGWPFSKILGNRSINCHPRPNKVLSAPMLLDHLQQLH